MIKYKGIEARSVRIHQSQFSNFLRVMSSMPVYAAAAACCTLSALLAARMKVRLGRMEHKDVTLASVLAGFHYVRKKRLLLGTFSLDLFAVLLGGATALLPVVLGLWASTIYLRHHFVVDLLAGFLLAPVALFVTPRLDAWWLAQRERSREEA